MKRTRHFCATKKMQAECNGNMFQFAEAMLFFYKSNHLQHYIKGKTFQKPLILVQMLN